MKRLDLGGRRNQQQPLPDNFLRLPTDVAVRRYHVESKEWGYLPVMELHRRVLVLSRHPPHRPRDSYTLVLSRDATWGLGISVAESKGHVRVCSVSDRILCQHAAIHKGDILMGVNGLTCHEISPNELHLLTRIVKFIRTCPSPVVLHLKSRSPTDTFQQQSSKGMTITLASHISHNSIASEESIASSSNKNKKNKNNKLLGNAKTLAQITERARQWQMFHSLYMDSKTGKLHTSLESLHPHMPPVGLWGHRCLQDQWLQQREKPSCDYTHRPRQQQQQQQQMIMTANNNINNNNGTVVAIPLIGVRKALSCRILNTFRDGDFTAFTIWVHDAESGREWYAPLRYYRDFEDLREATCSIHDHVATIPFPSQAWSLFGGLSSGDIYASDPDSVRWQLELFLKRLCTMIYLDDLQPAIAQVAVHVQSFLGCERALQHADSWPNIHTLDMDGVNICSWDGIQHSPVQVRTRHVLQRSLQMLTYRLLLLESVQTLISQFVTAARDNSPTLHDIEVMNQKSSNTLKDYSTKTLDRIKAAVDQVQELLLKTFAKDFRAMAQSGLYTCLQEFMVGPRGESYLERLVREAVREQVEIEVYLPLRSTASRLLVNAWRHEDAQVALKLKELRSRPLHDHYLIQNGWSTISDSVSRLFKKVSSCALPSSKLSALFDASMEISRMHRPKQQSSSNASSKLGNNNNDMNHCGADDFLPLLILCITFAAEVERPFALCSLLQSLCDPMSRNGEVGYYLASFQAAITHILEFDLSEGGDLWTNLLE